MVKILQIVFILVMILFVVKLVRLIIKYSSSSRPSVDDLKERAEKLRRQMNDVEEAEFREIPPEEDENSKT
ncbi:MAG TPA: hypothetical protein VI362_08385 [Ignavibacteriaceae bacterium]|nr:hypothetical protein [Ignavibacteriaceae bacterium]